MTSADPKADLPPVLRPEHSPRRPLADLVARFGARIASGESTDVTVEGITLATADLRPGEAFVAVSGGTFHGARFAGEAVRKGAVAIITDDTGAELAANCGVPIAVVDDPRAVLGALSAWMYDTCTNAPILFGTTGTNGKTSVTHLLGGILNSLGVLSGLSSTAERHIAGSVITSRLTTPEAPEFHALLALMRERGVEAVAVEVSAQALTRQRVDGVIFDVVGFTNLSHDHLDDYADMEAYFRAKVPLMQSGRAGRAVISLDSPWGARAQDAADIPTVSILTPAIAADPTVHADWVVEIVAERASGTTFRLVGADGRSLTSTVPLIGTHMAANAALAIVMLLEAGYGWDALVEALEGTTIAAHTPGRAERVSGDEGPAVYVDFGHSPDAFEKTLSAVRRVTEGRVLMLFGADGDRDRSKRREMGRVAASGSDILIITDHHPRHEDPVAIRAALLEGAHSADDAGEILEISPPERAIVAAVERVGEGDAILWAGPGHQDYRDIRGVRTPYSARELARRALRDAGWPVPEPWWPVPYPADQTPLSDPRSATD